MWPSFMYILQSDNYLFQLLLDFYLFLLLTAFFFNFLIVHPHDHLPSPCFQVHWSFWFSNHTTIDIEKVHLIILTKLQSHSTMQELMNSTTHQWSHSWYRSDHSPSLIVQDGGDTTING